MRRKDREVSDLREIEAIISRCQVCRLALATADGQPYAIALNFGYESGNPSALYFHCATVGKKLDLIRQNPRCAFILDRPLELVTGSLACDWGMRYESVMGTGSIDVLTDPVQRRQGLDCIMGHYGERAPDYGAKSLKHTLVLKLAIDTMTAKRRI